MDRFLAPQRAEGSTKTNQMEIIMHNHQLGRGDCVEHPCLFDDRDSFYHLLRSHRRKLLLLELNLDCGLPSCVRRWLCLAGSDRLLFTGLRPWCGLRPCISHHLISLNSTQGISPAQQRGGAPHRQSPKHRRAAAEQAAASRRTAEPQADGLLLKQRRAKIQL